MKIGAVVLAAGKGTRMKSDLPKPLHKVRGRTLLGWVLHAIGGVELSSIVVVVGHGREQVVDSLEGELGGRQFLFAEQLAPRGTGDAAAVGLAELDVHDGGFDDDEHVLVMPGDTPLLRPETVAELVASHLATDAACTMVTATLKDPTGYGRIIRTANGQVSAIVEERDATDDQRKITEVNAGMYCFRRSLLSPALRMITTDNAQGELYLTDVIGVLAEAGHHVEPFPADSRETAGVNDRAQLGSAANELADRIAETHMRNGVTIVAPASTVIDATVEIAPDVMIHSGCVLEGHTAIESGARIGPNSWLVDAQIGSDATVESAVVRGASVEPGAVVYPYVVIDGT